MLAIISRIFLGGARRSDATVEVTRPQPVHGKQASSAAPRERSRYQCQYQNPRSYSDFLIFRA
jgi:hypothetical protein